MVYDPRPQHLREAKNLAFENLRCKLLCINKPCAPLHVIVPSFQKIAHDHMYCLKPGSKKLPNTSSQSKNMTLNIFAIEKVTEAFGK